MVTVYTSTSKLASYLGPLSARQRNAIQMAFRWQTNSGPILMAFLWRACSGPILTAYWE